MNSLSFAVKEGIQFSEEGRIEFQNSKSDILTYIYNNANI